MIDNAQIGYSNNGNDNKNQKIKKLKPNLFNKMKRREIDGINRCITQLKLLNENDKLNINIIEGYLPKEIQYIDKKDRELPIYNLYEKSKYLSQIILYKIINKLNGNIDNLSKKCIMILLDCSLYIKDEKKIFNMLILCALTMALHSLNICYSIGLFGDDKFKIILKQYEEKHSLSNLQLVYECLMLKRYRCNLASVIDFAIDSKLFNNSNESSNKNFYERYPERIIYLITDGLDEKLFLVKEWEKKLNDNNNIGFGFIFNLPNKIKEILNDKIPSFLLDLTNNNIVKEDKYIETFFSEEYSFNINNAKNNENLDNNENQYEYEEYEDKREEEEEEEEEEEDADEIMPDKKDINLLLDMWNKFKSQKIENFRATIINSENDNLDIKTICILSNDFAELICRFNSYNNEEKYNSINDSYFDELIIDDSFFSNNFSFLDEQPYISINNKYNSNIIPINESKENEEFRSYLNENKGKIKNYELNEFEKNFYQSKIYNYFFFEIPKEITLRKSLENIFIPNKASQKVLSTSGSDIDINAFFIHYLSKDPEPLFYLEEKGGYIRKYSLTIIIDSSKSCFNTFNRNHTIETIKYLFRSLQFIEIPCLNVIISTKNIPEILCSHLSSKQVLKKGSDFWSSLMKSLSHSKQNTSLSSCLEISYYLNREREDYTNYIFVLTDGMFNNEEKEKVINYIYKCNQYDIKIFGVGVGFYPYNIKNIFQYIIYSKNPRKLIDSISYFFDRNIKVNKDIMTPLFIENQKDLINIIGNLLYIEKNTLTKLKDELNNNIIIEYCSFDKFNAPTDTRFMKNIFEGLNDPNLQLVKPGTLNGQKVLIVMLWSCKLNPEENKKIDPKYLYESAYINNPIDKRFCVEKAIKSLGGGMKVVINYKDAIDELCSTEKKKCPYYAVWIISGTDKCQLPDENADPNLLDQFMEVIDEYSKKGGSLVLFGESDPLFFQVNLFLKEHEFPTLKGKVKTKLRLCGNHKGMNILKGDETGKLENNKLFNLVGSINYCSISKKNKSNFPLVQRPSLGFNLFEIYEGETISYAEDNTDIFPFNKFAIDSEGGISILYYCGIEGHGDVIVDGGFTKCFLSMTEKGTYRYLQNLAGFTSRTECNFNKLVLPKKMNYTIKEIKAPIKIFKRNIFILDSEKFLDSSSISIVFSRIKDNYSKGDIIFMANTEKYKINITDLEKMKYFEPDLNFDNNKIINEINNFEKGLYNRIYVLDIGEQISENYKFGDLLLLNHNLNNYYNTTHSKCEYSNYNKYSLKEIKKIADKIIDLNSFEKYYIDIRNYLYSSSQHSNDEEENGLKILQTQINKIKYDLKFNSENSYKIKYEILKWRFDCVSADPIPTAADKESE